MKDKKIEEICNKFIRPISAGERSRYISEEEAKDNLRQTLLNFKQEVREETLSQILEEVKTLKHQCDEIIYKSKKRYNIELE